MTSYSSAEIISEMTSKVDSPTLRLTGEREATLTSGSWVMQPIASGVPIGLHYCDSTSDTVPIHINNRYDHKYIRQIQHFLHYSNWLHGDQWFAADQDYKINASSMNNFGSWAIYEIASASGSTLTLKCNGINDPRNLTVAWEATRETPNDPLTTTDTGGCMPQPGDMLTISGNSACTGRIQAKIESVNFSGLPTTPTTSSTFTVIIDQSIGSATTPYDPDDTDPATATITREAYRPEAWLSLNDVEWMKVKKTVETIDNPSGTHTISGRIAIPTNDYFSCLINYGTHTTNSIPPITCDNTNTYLDLSVFSGAQSLTLTYWLESTATDACALCPNRCHFDRPLNDITTSVNGTDNGRFCALRNSLNKEVVDQFEDKCWLMGTCPYFLVQIPDQVNEITFAQILQGQNTREYQLQPGFADIRNWVVERALNPSFHWLLNPAGNSNTYHSPLGYYPYVGTQSGGFILDTGIYTFPISANQQLTYVNGAMYNYGYSTSSLTFPTMPDDLRGVIPRSMSAYTPKRSYGINEAYTSTNDPMCNRWWCGSRKLTSSLRDIKEYGVAFAANHRNTYGIEAENRNQRFNRTTESYIDGVIKSNGTYGSWHKATVSASTMTLRFYADGVQDYGQKQLGVTTIKRVESDSGSIYKVHCNPYYQWVGNTDSPETDVIRPLWRGGNVVKLPDPYDCTNFYSEEWNRFGSPWTKTIEGDTIKIGDKCFYVTKALPCHGDTFDSIEASIFKEHHTAGGYFSPIGMSTDSSISVSDFEIAIFTSDPDTGAWTDGQVTAIVPGQTRTASVYLDIAQDCKLLFERKSTTVDGHTINEGTGKAYLTLGNYYWAFMTSVINRRQARIKYTIDTVPGDWQTIDIEPVTLSFNYLGANPENWTIKRLNPDGTTTTLVYDGSISEALTFNIAAVQYDKFKVISDGGVVSKILLHPNNSGCDFECTYETSTTYDIGDYPSAHGGTYPNVASLTYLKKCDLLYVQDEQGYIADNYSEMTGAAFTIQTNGILYNNSTTKLYWAAYDTDTWYEIETFSINYCEGTITVDDISSLPQKFNLKLVCPKANRTQEQSAETTIALGKHIELLDTVREDLSAPGSESFSVSCQANISFDNWDYYGTRPYGYDYPAGGLTVGTSNFYLPATQDLTQWVYGLTTDWDLAPYKCMDDFKYSVGYSSAASYAFGCLPLGTSLPADNSIVGQTITAGGIGCTIFKWIFNKFICRLPAGTTIVSAKMEMTAPDDLSVSSSTVYRTIMPYNGSYVWVYTSGAAADTTTTSSNMTINWQMVGKSNNDKWGSLGNFASGSLITAGKQKVVDATQLIQQMINYKSSGYKEIGFYINSGSGGSIPSGLINGDSSVAGVVVGLLRGGMLQINSLGSNSEDGWSSAKRWYYSLSSQRYTASDQIGLGACHIVYRLPDSVVNREITIGNTVGLKPIV